MLFFAFHGLAQDKYDGISAGITANMRAYSIYSTAKKVDYKGYEDQHETFNFGLLGEDTLTIQIYKSFKFAEKFRRLDGKAIRGKVVEDLSQLTPDKGIRVLYVNNTGRFRIEDVLKAIEGTNILLITEAYPFEQSMVNFTEEGTMLRYEVNLTRMRDANLEPKALLVKLSSRTEESFSDASKIFSALEDSEDIELTKDDLRLIISDYNQKLEQIDMQRNEIAEQTMELEKLMGDVDHAKSLLTEREKEIELSMSEIKELNKRHALQESILRQTKQKLATEVARLDELKQEFERRKKAFVEEVSGQEELLAIKSAEVDSIDSRIAVQRKILTQKENEIADKEAQIQVQEYILLGGIILLIALVGVGLLIYKNYRDKKKANEALENKNAIIEHQKSIVEIKNKEIIDSINYAKRLQDAILPSNTIIRKELGDSFVVYKPKDIVAGDFYWMEPQGDRVLFAACDCTGHGVPGAMVSVVCNNGLNRAVREYKLDEPGAILDKTREIIIQEFGKANADVKDGMDVALCSLEGSKLSYAGAHNPLWIIRKGSNEVEEVKADKQPIGLFDNPKPYQSHTTELNTGDTVYLFTDGYADQFGGERGKKFKASNFKQLLLSIQKESMSRQKELIEEVFESWKGDLEQLDDVCVIGVRV